ncbi:hypothetical protein N7475_008815, partial [Penicillium sp. IBT 31633x]
RSLRRISKPQTLLTMNDPIQPLDVLVIGAGIAGLTAAIALGKQGHRVVILEKSGFLRETGAAIHVPPNCTAMLRWMDIDPADVGGTLLEKIHRYGSEGELIYEREFADVRHHWQAVGGPSAHSQDNALTIIQEWYLVHRVELHNHLKQRASETATLHTRCRIIDTNLDVARPSVTLDDGRIFQADLLLGADGLHSQIRQSIAPDSSSPYPVGKSCFRWLLRTDELKRHESTAEFVRASGVFIEWESEDRRIVAYPCSDSKMLNICAFVPSNEKQTDAKGDLGWQEVGDKSKIIEAFSQFSPGVQKIIQSADDCPRVWDLYDMETMPTWTRGHAALLGDAAHPFQPYMGQGAAMAIEDAVSLATLLPRGTAPHDIPTRLRLYQTARRSRVEFVLHYTRLNGRDGNDETGSRISAAEMVKIMGICFSHNEIEHSAGLLQNEMIIHEDTRE